ncbi:hypothetical protein [Nocardioides daejeonensis]|uniref:hypothetical protein n=1 Tax=Nocardioides daejeonensis TaxID=1046556 RepID=UPI000D740BDB|nr:hypothetical protein [Nocardioides daejeonensis]
MLPGPLRLRHRTRPVRVVSDLPRGSDDRIPSRAVEVVADAPRTRVALQTPDLRAEAWYDATTGRAGIDLIGADKARTRLRSRRQGRVDAATDRVAMTLTGRQLSLLTRAQGIWTVQAKVDLAHTPGPDGQTSLDPRAVEVVTDAEVVAEGRFGQLGLRDLHLVTHAEGEPVTRDGCYYLTATHAGPGFFATAHCGVWRFDPRTYELEHTADLWFEREGRVWGDHAVHLVRDGGSWLVAASTWGDFDHDDVGITVARSDADLLSGEHVLGSLPLDLAGSVTDGVAAWDPHLTRIDGHWHLAFVVASEFFVFRPVLARAVAEGRMGPWQLLGDARERTATEGTQIVRIGSEWRVLASDGPDNPRQLRQRFPVFDLRLREVGTLAAAYPSNLPWPTLVDHGGSWLMITFDGTPYGGRVAGYGTHGDVLVFDDTTG